MRWHLKNPTRPYQHTLLGSLHHGAKFVHSYGRGDSLDRLLADEIETVFVCAKVGDDIGGKETGLAQGFRGLFKAGGYVDCGSVDSNRTLGVSLPSSPRKACLPTNYPAVLRLDLGFQSLTSYASLADCYFSQHDVAMVVRSRACPLEKRGGFNVDVAIGAFFHPGGFRS